MCWANYNKKLGSKMAKTFGLKMILKRSHVRGLDLSMSPVLQQYKKTNCISSQTVRILYFYTYSLFVSMHQMM